MLCNGFRLGLLRFFLLTGSFLCRRHRFLLHALGLGLRLLRVGAGFFRLRTSHFRIRTTLGFRFRIRTSFGFARCCCSLRFVFRLLLHRHQPRFFGSLGGFLRRRFYGRLVLLLPVDLFRVQQSIPKIAS